MSASIECAGREIRSVIARSPVPEDLRHAENTLQWLLRLQPDARHPLQLAALAHDIERAIPKRRVNRTDFDDYDAFKAAHARNSARILRPILALCGMDEKIMEEVCRLVEHHEFGGDPASDLLKDADGISFFDVNLPLYYRREGEEEARRRSRWGFLRLSPQGREIVKGFSYEDRALNRLLQQVIRASGDLLMRP